MFEEKLKKIVERFDFLEKKMQGHLDRNVLEEYSKEYSELKDVREIITQFFFQQNYFIHPHLSCIK